MIRYLLKIPRKAWERPDIPRREVQVFMSANSADEPARIEFVGDDKDVTTVQKTLFSSATGVWGAFIEKVTTPENMVAGLHCPIMQKYDPEPIQDNGMFETIQTTASQKVRLAEDIVNLYVETLPAIPSFEPSVRAELIERLRLILLRGRVLIQDSQLSDNEASTFLCVLSNRFTASGLEVEQLEPSIQEADHILKLVHFPPPPTSEQVTSVLRQLAQIFESPESIDLNALFKKLEVEFTVSVTHR